MTENAKERAAETTAGAEHIGRVLERVEINLSQEELQRLASFYEKYLEQLAALHAVDLDDEEVAGVFAPSWPPERGTTP